MLLLELLGRALAFERKIPDLLGPGIQFAKLLLRIRFTADRLQRGIAYFTRVPDKLFQVLADQLLPLFPEFVRRGHLPPAVIEENGGPEVALRRHVFL